MTTESINSFIVSC